VYAGFGGLHGVYCIANTFFASEWVHKAETMGNHIVELALPVLLLVPHRRCNIIGGAVQILFQVGVVSTKHYFIGALVCCKHSSRSFGDIAVQRLRCVHVMSQPPRDFYSWC
jgi:hypothetical protein